ncbi:unnamed protein product [Caenorhabditis auriculariae]|uniref:non-specific serine/threonine protein kinase n=1 Tax=Caenorhabditis auriculariae TaxID=2777116 RepID=A0A8S1HGK8_9PELO|nr:unnamed protein product [Caenorhabditis auriculariae]
MPDEEDVMANIRFKDGKKFGDWVIKKKLDEGGFGQVYMVQNLKTNEKAALKAESNEVEGGSAIKLEILILRDLNRSGPKPHIPVYFHAAKRGKFSYMIMTLLGENLKALKLNCQNGKERFSRGTWSRLGIQCLYSVKYVHDCGYVHRDIKPNNFVMGAPDDQARCRLVHILDFGLARAYAFQRDSKWVTRRARGTAEFRGTLRYCSPNVHFKKEQGRQDDLWSLLYVLVEFNGGLPWQHEREKSKIEGMKIAMDDKDVMLNMPICMQAITPHLRSLDCYAKPDYVAFYNALLTIMKAEKVTPLSRYDWETATEEESAKKYAKEKGPAAWEDAEAFFKADPISIAGPPNNNETEKSASRTMTKEVPKGV